MDGSGRTARKAEGVELRAALIASLSGEPDRTAADLVTAVRALGLNADKRAVNRALYSDADSFVLGGVRGRQPIWRLAQGDVQSATVDDGGMVGGGVQRVTPMPEGAGGYLRHNDETLRLLGWHGHSSGGVRVPFSSEMGRPLGPDAPVFATPVIEKLRALAVDLASGAPAPRVIFLVGGPGNGKSEAVEEFVRSLDESLMADGAVVGAVVAQLHQSPVIARRVDVATAGLRRDGRVSALDRVVLVQDASASDDPSLDAAEQLVTDLEDVLTHPTPVPVYVCSVNRGILSRAVEAARLSQSEIAGVLEVVIQASSIAAGVEGPERSCWPLAIPEPAMNGVIAAWPLDLQSLLLDEGVSGIPVPLLDMLSAVTAESRWEQADCGDCASRTVCPFRQNAAWLRDRDRQEHVTQLLRRAELGASKRWNFRELYSFVAEMLVGNWPDFEPAAHPCDWVHEQAEASTAPEATVRTGALIAMSQRLYAQALFPVLRADLPVKPPRNANARGFVDASRSLASVSRGHARALLAGSVATLTDPALASPDAMDNPLRRLEEAYSQSVRLGGGVWRELAALSNVEDALQRESEEAEALFDFLKRDIVAVREAWTFLKVLLCTVAKRSVWATTGRHANDTLLKRYEDLLRDEEALRDPRRKITDLLGVGGFSYEATAAFGQPRSSARPFVVLEGDAPRINAVVPAPVPTDRAPAHDFPVLSVGNQAVPLTYQLFEALQLSSEGCSSGSLPAAVRAQLDRIRQLHAGILCRDADEFRNDRALYRLGQHGVVSISASGRQVVFRSAQ